MLNVNQESCEYHLLKSFDLTRPSTDYEDALTTRPRAGVLRAVEVYLNGP